MALGMRHGRASLRLSRRLTRLLVRSAPRPPLFIFFFFNDTATTEIYTLSLHDALPISARLPGEGREILDAPLRLALRDPEHRQAEGSVEYLDRKSTRLNSSHLVISYAVFCLKKKKHRQC